MGSPRFSLVSLGCSKNQVDSENMYTALVSAGLEFAPEGEDCDLCLINTCGFIKAAKKESAEIIIDIVRQKKEGRLKYIVVTGCLVNNNISELAVELPEVDLFLTTFNEDALVEELEKLISGSFDNFSLNKHAGRQAYEREHFNLINSAYLKISEGCDRSCSFCTIPSIRGRFKSRDIDEVRAEAEYLAGRGVKEIILVSQDTIHYGMDLKMNNGLYRLLRELIKIKGIKWIRLLYLYPSKTLFTDELISLINNEEKIVKYLDVPFQHISDKILKLMKRPEKASDILNLISRLRSGINGVSLRTTLITGFPGESEDDFLALLNFVRDIKFENLGVFKYSDEKDAPSFSLEDKIKFRVKNERYKTIMKIQSGIAGDILRGYEGKIYEAVVDGLSGNFVKARTFFQSPDVDGCIYFPAEDLINTDGRVRPADLGKEAGTGLILPSFESVKVVGSRGYDLIGTAVFKNS